MVERNDTGPAGPAVNTDANADAAADAALRALFAEADRPPMGDERFTKAVMARVQAQASWRRQVRMAVGVGLGACAAALLAPHLGGGAADISSSLTVAAAMTPGLGASAATLLGFGLLCAAGWAMADSL
jgi:hypothetical protein